MFKKRLTFITLAAASLMHGCGVSDNEQGPVEKVDISPLTVHNFPKVDGSTSTRPMMRTIACEIFDVQYRWLSLPDGTSDVWPDDDDTAKADEVTLIRNMWFTGTHQAYVNLISDSTEIIIVAREPSEDELHLADSANVALTITPVALDGLVFILNSANLLNNLTSEQIINIYTGAATNWRDVGGVNAKISPYSRNRNSGSQELMEKLVMRGRRMIDAPDMISLTMMGLINKVEGDTNGIGYTVYFYNTTMVPRPLVKMISVNNVYPSATTIANRRYAYTAPVVAVIRRDIDVNSTAYLFWRWLQTSDGQGMISKSGYVPYQ